MPKKNEISELYINLQDHRTIIIIYVRVGGFQILGLNLDSILNLGMIRLEGPPYNVLNNKRRFQKIARKNRK